MHALQLPAGNEAAEERETGKETLGESEGEAYILLCMYAYRAECGQGTWTGDRGRG